MNPTHDNRSDEAKQLIRQIFGENTMRPPAAVKAPVMAEYCAKITPQLAPKRAIEGAPTIGEEFIHMMDTMESYLNDCCIDCLSPRNWSQLVVDGKAYEAFEELRFEAEKMIGEIQLERQLNYNWLGKPATVRNILWHLADHTAHHRGRLALLLRLIGEEPPEL